MANDKWPDMAAGLYMSYIPPSTANIQMSPHKRYSYWSSTLRKKPP